MVGQYGHDTVRAESRLAPSQWEMSLQSNAISHWLGANLESALYYHCHGSLILECSRFSPEYSHFVLLILLWSATHITHWDQNKMAAILQTSFSNAFLDSNFTEDCSLGSNGQHGAIGSDNRLMLIRQQVFIWTNDGLIYWHVYAWPFFNELPHWGRDKMTTIFWTTFSMYFLEWKCVNFK